MFPILIEDKNATLPDAFLPVEVNPMDDNKIRLEEQLKLFNDRIYNVSAQVQEWIARCSKEDEAYRPEDLKGRTCVAYEPILSRLKMFFVSWLKYMVIFTVRNSEVVKYRNILLGEGENAPTIRNTVTTRIMTEMARMYYLLHRPKYMMEGDKTFTLAKDAKHTAWVTAFSLYNVEYEDKEAPHIALEEKKQAMQKELWNAPLRYMRQSQLYRLLDVLTQMIHDVTEAVLPEYEQAVHHAIIAFYYNIQFSHDGEQLDMENMRLPHLIMDEKTQTPVESGYYKANMAYYVYCCSYLSEIMRRLYYRQLYDSSHYVFAPHDHPSKYKHHVKHWLLHLIDSGQLPMDTLEDVFHERAMGEANTYPGDRAIFVHRYPDKVPGRMDIMQFLRPHLFRRSEHRQVQPKVLIESAADDYASRLFIMWCVNEILSVKYKDSTWFDKVVVDADGIEMDVYRLTINHVNPILLQVLSSFWVYHSGKVFITDDIFEAIAAWFIVLRIEYNNRFNRYRLGHVYREIFKEHPDGPLADAQPAKPFQFDTL